MSCTTAHRYKVAGYRHHIVHTSSQITTRELITVEEWSNSARWFGLQKIRQYAKRTLDTTVSYRLENEDSAIVAIVECQICNDRLEVRSSYSFCSDLKIFI